MSQPQGDPIDEGLADEVASDQEASSPIDVRTSESLRYHAKLTKSELRSYLYNTFGKHPTDYKIVRGSDKPVDVEVK